MIWATGETVTGQHITVGPDHELRFTGDLLQGHIPDPLDRSCQRLDLATLRRQDIQIRAKPLDGQLRLHAGQQLVDAGRNRLGKRE
jgi:hypothetical protein